MKFSMKMAVPLLALVTTACLVVVPPPPPRPRPVRHPNYLQALSDLRLARAYLNRGEVVFPDLSGPQVAAMSQVDGAIDALWRASIRDGRDPRYAPPIDANLGRGNLFHKVMDLLNSARANCAREEDDVQTRGLRANAIGHIDNARNIIANQIFPVTG